MSKPVFFFSFFSFFLVFFFFFVGGGGGGGGGGRRGKCRLLKFLPNCRALNVILCVVSRTIHIALKKLKNS